MAAHAMLVGTNDGVNCTFRFTFPTTFVVSVQLYPAGTVPRTGAPHASELPYVKSVYVPFVNPAPALMLIVPLNPRLPDTPIIALLAPSVKFMTTDGSTSQLFVTVNVALASVMDAVRGSTLVSVAKIRALKNARRLVISAELQPPILIRLELKTLLVSVRSTL